MTLNKFEPGEQTIGFIGAGNMAEAIARGLIKSGHDPRQIIMSNPTPSKLERLSDELNVTTTHQNQMVCDKAQVILLTIKPQLFDAVLGDLDFSSVDCVISVAAGVPVAQIESLVGNGIPVVRSMPNTPATELVGSTGVYVAPTHKSALANIVDYVFGAIGRYVWIDDESLMNAVTAISGSAPAYFFQFVESLIAAGVTEGLSEQDAKTLVVQTALGSANMMVNHSDQSVAELRQQVTSPGGTTAAALQSFTNDNFEDVIHRAVHAAVERGRALAANK